MDGQQETIKDSGERSTFTTGAQRDAQQGKGRFDLIPLDFLFEYAKLLEQGALKYEARNWEQGIPLSRFVDSGMRHLFKYLRGDRDEPHLIQAMFNFIGLYQTTLWIEQGKLSMSLNDIPNHPIIQDDKIE